MQIIGSPNISSLDYKITWDVSGNQPAIVLVNLSTGDALSGLTWWGIATSPTGTLIHEGSELSPDISGPWTTYTYNDAFPKPFNSLEFSGAPYSFTLFTKDSAGNIYSLTKTATICRPNGNTQNSKNPYGKAKTDVVVKCQEARVYFSDISDYSYKGITGERVSSILKVIYPIDQTGNIPAPFTLSNFSSALVPITYSSENYQFWVRTIYDYDFGDNVHVRIQYFQSETFAVWCNVGLQPLICEYTKLIDDIENGNCSDVQEANRKLMLINPKLSMVIMGTLQPLTGINVPKLIDEIKEIGGFDCDCCSVPTGIIPQVASVIDGYSFSVTSTGGDISGTVVTTGTNIEFQLADKSYVFAIYPDSPMDTTAFTVIPQTSGSTKTYYLKVDANQLATDILNIIKNDGALVNLFNSIVSGGNGTGTGQLIVDGNCIFDSSDTCDFTFIMANIPVSGSFAILSNVRNNEGNIPLNFSFNLTNLPALQTYLNTLSLGTFSVTNPYGQAVLVSSFANNNDLLALSYKLTGSTFLADYTRECAGFTPLSANEVVQKIIDYICVLDDSQIVTSQNYEISYIDGAGIQQTQTVNSGTALNDFLAQLVTLNLGVVTYVKAIGSLTCDQAKNIYQPNALQVTANDVLHGTKGNGACSGVSYLDVFKFMLSAGVQNADVRQLFCDFAASCVQGLSCAPDEFFDVIVSNYSTTCVEIVGLDVTINP